ncbi:hypothetical protein D0864_07218 [Hortaea werneckii]|uniref:F-box domain-containing protein n=1 Tax=Hortaea werneckii TaxID=91943 RepID=A0A3M7FAB4_HORWE|nr:hypothetical protein D0864_07218 [Hortaea werneckii]
MTQCRTDQATLQGLPAELRMRIYDYIFEYPLPAIIFRILNHDVYNPYLPLPGELAVMRTCQQLERECSAHFYGSMTVSVGLLVSPDRMPFMAVSCVGSIDQVRLWPFICHLVFLLELNPDMNADAFMAQLTCFLRAIHHGKNLKTIEIRLQSYEADKKPDCLDGIVNTLCTGLQVEGQVEVTFVSINSGADRQSDYEKRLADRITKAIST